MKQKIRYWAECLALIRMYPRVYWKYWTQDRRTLYRALRAAKIRRIRPASQDDWKLWYGCCYFSGLLEGKPVFIKVMGPAQRDCFENEQLLDAYVEAHSPWLRERRPKIRAHVDLGDRMALVYDRIEMTPMAHSPETQEAVAEALREYTRAGILHTDFGATNMGVTPAGYCFIDYGTSLCPESNGIRVRNGKVYNHLEHRIPAAEALLPDADFYYDDAIHVGRDDLDRNNMNFLVGRKELYYARLGNQILQYSLEPKAAGSKVMLLRRAEKA